MTRDVKSPLRTFLPVFYAFFIAEATPVSRSRSMHELWEREDPRLAMNSYMGAYSQDPLTN